MTMKFKDGWTGGAYTLPNTLTIKGLPDIQRQNNMADFAFGQGRYPAGDWIVRAKKVRIEGWFVNNTDYEEFCNAILKEPDSDYVCVWFFPYDDDWAWRVAAAKLKATYEKGGFDRILKLTCDLELMFDAIEYKSVTTSGATDIDSDPNSDTTLSPVVSVESPMKLTLTAAATLASGFTIEEAIGGQTKKTMVYAGALVNNDVVIIDGVTGDVTLNGSDDLDNFSGQFPLAYTPDIDGTPRVHTFRVTGAGYAGTWATLVTEYRKNLIGSLHD